MAWKTSDFVVLKRTTGHFSPNQGGYHHRGPTSPALYPKLVYISALCLLLNSTAYFSRFEWQKPRCPVGRLVISLCSNFANNEFLVAFWSYGERLPVDLIDFITVVSRKLKQAPYSVTYRSMSIMATLEAQSAAEAAAAELRQMSRSPNPTYGRDFAIERRVSLHPSSM